MKIHLIASLALGLIATSGLAEDKKMDLKDAKQRNSYAIGSDIGANLKRQELEIDPQALAAGISDKFNGKAALTEAEVRETLEALKQQLMKKAQAKQVELEAKSKA